MFSNKIFKLNNTREIFLKRRRIFVILRFKNFKIILNIWALRISIVRCFLKNNLLKNFLKYLDSLLFKKINSSTNINIYKASSLKIFEKLLFFLLILSLSLKIFFIVNRENKILKINDIDTKNNFCRLYIIMYFWELIENKSINARVWKLNYRFLYLILFRERLFKIYL